MKNKLTLPLLTVTTLMNSTAKAEVDLSNGSYIHRLTSANLTMIYNSRSLHRGLLGLGWCSPLEDSIQTINSSVIRLRNCREGRIITYKLKDRTLRSPSSNLKIFESGANKIVESENKYELQQGDMVRSFDKNGHLLQVKDERGKITKLIYDKNGFLKEVLSGRKDALQLKVDPRTGRVVEAIDHQGARTRLTFLRGNLISIAGPRMAQYFTYDANTNLIETTDMKKVTTVTYDSSDQVISVQTAPNCSETYSYKVEKLNRQTEVVTNCRGINNKRLVDFFYSKESSGEISLTNVTVKDLHHRSRLPATYKTESF